MTTNSGKDAALIWAISAPEFTAVFGDLCAELTKLQHSPIYRGSYHSHYSPPGSFSVVTLSAWKSRTLWEFCVFVYLEQKVSAEQGSRKARTSRNQRWDRSPKVLRLQMFIYEHMKIGFEKPCDRVRSKPNCTNMFFQMIPSGAIVLLTLYFIGKLISKQPLILSTWHNNLIRCFSFFNLHIFNKPSNLSAHK